MEREFSRYGLPRSGACSCRKTGEAVLLQFLARRGLRMPEPVSLASSYPIPGIACCVAAIAHVRWDSGPVVRHILRWVAAVSRGQQDRKQTVTLAGGIGTICPVSIPRPAAARSVLRSGLS